MCSYYSQVISCSTVRIDNKTWNNLPLLDTDSYCFKAKVGNLEEKLKELSYKLDFSNLDKSHPMFDDSHKNELGRFKIETGLKARIIKCICLRSKSKQNQTVNYCQAFALVLTNAPSSAGKCYCLLMQKYVSMTMEEVTKAKGVDFSAQQQLTCQEYLQSSWLLSLSWCHDKELMWPQAGPRPPTTCLLTKCLLRSWGLEHW